MELRRTGIKASDLEVQEALRLHNIAKLDIMPKLVMASGKTRMSVSEREFHRFVHSCALAKGLPEIDGYYGIDLKTYEFVEYK